MMPIAIQLQAPVRYFSDVDPLADGAHTRSASFADRPIDPPCLLRAEDRWLRSVVSGRSAPQRARAVRGHFDGVGVRRRCQGSAPAPLCLRASRRSAFSRHPPGQLMVGDVSTLTFPQQIDLFDWLDRFADVVQVVSLTSVPLWPLVEQGRFFEGLFYRLNVVTLTAGPHGRSPLSSLYVMPPSLFEEPR